MGRHLVPVEDLEIVGYFLDLKEMRLGVRYTA